MSLLPAYLRHFGEPPGDPREARTPAFSRVHAGLLDSRVVVVGVEQSQLERRRRDRQQKVQEGGQQSAPTRPSAHRGAVRKNTHSVAGGAQHM